MPHYLISYDVSCARRRDRLSRRLEKEGQRIQLSVFIVELGHDKCRELMEELLEIIAAEDSLLCLPVCAHCLEGAMLSCPLPPVMSFF